MLAALQAKLGIGDGQVFKAGSALSGGIAGYGETCGALTGSIMAIGCLIGRERLEDREQAMRARAVAQEMYQRFREANGHSLCAEIQKIKFGRSYRLYDPEDMQAFHAAGAHDRTGCPDVCGKAARIAADILLRLQAQA